MRKLIAFVFVSSLAISLSAQQPASVSMTSFNAVARNKEVLLSWNFEVANVKSYEVEKSKNALDYVPFGKIQGADVASEFIETDFMPYDGLSYYRLKLTNADGTVSYSNVVPVKYDEGGLPTSPVPTAATSTEVSSDKSILVIVRSASGDEYYSKVNVTSAGDPVECFNPDPNLSHGTYTIVGCSEQDLYSRQLVVQ